MNLPVGYTIHGYPQQTRRRKVRTTVARSSLDYIFSQPSVFLLAVSQSYIHTHIAAP